VIITLNGERHELAPAETLSVAELLTKLEIDARRVAVEHNLIVVKRAAYADTVVRDGDAVEIVNFVGGGKKREFRREFTGSRGSRVRGFEGSEVREVHDSGFLGSMTHFDCWKDVHVAADRRHGQVLVAVGDGQSARSVGGGDDHRAVRRVNISDRTKESLLDYIDTSKYVLLPNTAGCYTADEAIRTARLGREAGLSEWVKLEVIGDERTLFPDNEALLEATRVLVREGFVVLPYTSDDPIVCRKLEDAGAARVMPLGAPIGSGLGIQNQNNLRIIREFAGCR
jgi:thiamine biosynthesis protein ThiS